MIPPQGGGAEAIEANELSEKKSQYSRNMFGVRPRTHDSTVKSLQYQITNVLPAPSRSRLQHVADLVTRVKTFFSRILTNRQVFAAEPDGLTAGGGVSAGRDREITAFAVRPFREVGRSTLLAFGNKFILRKLLLVPVPLSRHSSLSLPKNVHSSAAPAELAQYGTPSA